MTVDNTLRPFGPRSRSLSLVQKAIEQPERSTDDDAEFASDFTGLPAEEAKIDAGFYHDNPGARPSDHPDWMTGAQRANRDKLRDEQRGPDPRMQQQEYRRQAAEFDRRHGPIWKPEAKAVGDPDFGRQREGDRLTPRSDSDAPNETRNYGHNYGADVKRVPGNRRQTIGGQPTPNHPVFDRPLDRAIAKAVADEVVAQLAKAGDLRFGGQEPRFDTPLGSLRPDSGAGPNSAADKPGHGQRRQPLVSPDRRSGKERTFAFPEADRPLNTAKVDEHLDANGSSAHHQQGGGQWWKDSAEQADVHQHDPGDLTHGEDSPWGSSQGGLRHSHSHDASHGRAAPINIRPDDPSVVRGHLSAAMEAPGRRTVRKFAAEGGQRPVEGAEEEEHEGPRWEALEREAADLGILEEAAQPVRPAKQGFSLRRPQPQQAASPAPQRGGYEFNPDSHRFGQARVSPGGSAAGQPGGSMRPKRPNFSY